MAMERDESIFVTGISVDYSAGVFGSTTEALKRFGPSRVFDAPAMENALTGIAIGAAAMGKRPVIVHPRVDFMFLAFDQLINLAAKWKYMFGGNAGSVPIVVRAIVGRGWGQGATHSQSTHSLLGHFPGLSVVMPATPEDAKFMTMAALRADYPTVIIEHRSLYETSGHLADFAFLPNSPRALREGDHVTLVASSYSVIEATRAADELETHGIFCDIIDVRCARPLDMGPIISRAKKTGHLVVCDTSWPLYGLSAEIVASVAEAVPGCVVKRIAHPDCPAPVAHSLEQAFYPTVNDIVCAAGGMVGRYLGNDNTEQPKSNFVGPY